MTDTEQIRQQVQSPAPFSTWFGVVLLMILFFVIAVAIIGPGPRGDTYEQQRAQKREENLKKLRDDDSKALTGYAWIDKTKGSVRIPIERAMQLAVVDLANKKPTAAGPIATPAPAAETSPAAGAPGTASPAPAGAAAASPAKATSISGPKSESHGQPTGAINPPPAQPGTQPNASAAPAPAKTGAVPASPIPSPTPPGNPLPVRGATPSPSP